MMKYVREPRGFADGGFVGDTAVVSASGGSISGGSQPPKMDMQVHIHESGSGGVEKVSIESFWTSPEGKRQLIEEFSKEVYIERGGKGLSKAIIDVQQGRG